jgi:hypothetical protein
MSVRCSSILVIRDRWACFSFAFRDGRSQQAGRREGLRCHGLSVGVGRIIALKMSFHSNRFSRSTLNVVPRNYICLAHAAPSRNGVTVFESPTRDDPGVGESKIVALVGVMLRYDSEPQ